MNKVALRAPNPLCIPPPGLPQSLLSFPISPRTGTVWGPNGEGGPQGPCSFRGRERERERETGGQGERGEGTPFVTKNKISASVYGVSSPEVTLGWVACSVHFTKGAFGEEGQGECGETTCVFRTLILPFTDTHWVPVMFLTSLGRWMFTD